MAYNDHTYLVIENIDEEDLSDEQADNLVNEIHELIEENYPNLHTNGAFGVAMLLNEKYGNDFAAIEDEESVAFDRDHLEAMADALHILAKFHDAKDLLTEEEYEDMRNALKASDSILAHEG